MSARRATTLLIGLSLLAGGVALGYRLGQAARSAAPPTLPAALVLGAVDAGVKPAPTAAATAEPESLGATTPLQRYRVCRGAGAGALLIPMGSGPGGHRWAIHCGDRVHVIGFDLDPQAGPRPRRLAELRLRVGQPAMGALPGRLATLDADADGIDDLLIGQRLVSDLGPASTGALHLLRGSAGGGWQPARSLGHPALVGLSAMEGPAGQPRAAVLHGAETGGGRGAELWSYGLAQEPGRLATLELPTEGVQAVALDLDGDGVDELAVALKGSHGLWLLRQTESGLEPTTAEPLEGEVRELALGDLTGDGRDDLVVLGKRLRVRAAGTTDTVPKDLFEAVDMRDLQLRDVDGDGRLDVVGYSHPEWVALLNGGDLHFKRRTLASRAGGEPGTLSSALDELNGNGRPELLLLGVAADSPATVELVLATDVELGGQLTTASEAIDLPDAPLVLRIELP